MQVIAMQRAVVSRSKRWLILVAFLPNIGCAPMPDGDPVMQQSDHSQSLVFQISGDTQPCVGVGPRRCLLVNGELFYDSIEGYDHVEGRSARICVLRTRRNEPIPADASIYEYRAIECSGE